MKRGNGAAQQGFKMYDLVICEMCGTSFYATTHSEVCVTCAAHNTPAKPAVTKIDDKAIAARQTAKAFGAKALKGTAAQKQWAEKIRASVMADLSFEDALRVGEMHNMLGTAKFWIENFGSAYGKKAKKTTQQFREFLRDQKSLMDAYKAADATESEAIAEKYNALTTAWGFK